MRDVREKYVRLNIDFPNKAGKLRQVIETQKRLVNKLSKLKQTDDIKALLLAVSEGYDVSIDLLEYMKLVLHGVANDAEILADGGKSRNIIKMQSEEIQALWDKLK